MKIGSKVFVVSGFQFDSDILFQGEVSGIRGGFVSVKTKGIQTGPYPGNYVMADTAKNRQLYASFLEKVKAWKALEPNVYIFFNALDK